MGVIDTPMIPALPNVDAQGPEGLSQFPSKTTVGATALFDRSYMATGVPMGRVAEAFEVANLALYLASDESSYSTGSEFVVCLLYTSDAADEGESGVRGGVIDTQMITALPNLDAQGPEGLSQSP